MPRAAIGIGSNTGDPVAHVRRALARLGALGTVIAASPLYRTPPWGVGDQAPFVNAAALLETALTPRALLAALKAIETDEGRVPTYRWGPRALDLDILTYADIALHEADLIVPHPQLRRRAFALVPLAAIDSRWAAARDALPPGELAAVVELNA